MLQSGLGSPRVGCNPKKLFGDVNALVGGCDRRQSGLWVGVAPTQVIFRCGTLGNGGVLGAMMGSTGVGCNPQEAVWECK